MDLSQKQGDEEPSVFFSYIVIGHCIDENSCDDASEYMFDSFEDFLKCFFLGNEFER